ncbi:MAG: hypothetical protein HY304_08975 [candidate division Zixibacteria bacterium]|nr:hypothetical protein [candidate division Zixibacteria bacterium]
MKGSTTLAMRKRWIEIASLRFVGARFQDHALDMSAILELPKFQKIFVSLAKDIWRERNPERKKLPEKFESFFRLRVRRIGRGSATVPLELPTAMTAEDDDLFGEKNSVASEAMRLIHSTIASIERRSALPKSIPRHVVEEMVPWGGFENEDEAICVRLVNKGEARFTSQSKDRIRSYLAEPHEDNVDEYGEVFEADVRAGRFQMTRRDGKRIGVDFKEDQEATITTALKEHRAQQLHVRGRGLYTSTGSLLKITRVDHMRILEHGETSSGQPSLVLSARPIWEELVELADKIPEEKWDGVPSDLSSTLDEYLYGKKLR